MSRAAFIDRFRYNTFDTDKVHDIIDDVIRNSDNKFDRLDALSYKHTDEDHLETALRDNDPHVRAHARSLLNSIDRYDD